MTLVETNWSAAGPSARVVFDCFSPRALASFYETLLGMTDRVSRHHRSCGHRQARSHAAITDALVPTRAVPGSPLARPPVSSAAPLGRAVRRQGTRAGSGRASRCDTPTAGGRWMPYLRRPGGSPFRPVRRRRLILRRFGVRLGLPPGGRKARLWFTAVSTLIRGRLHD